MAAGSPAGRWPQREARKALFFEKKKRWLFCPFTRGLCGRDEIHIAA
jgi:hypothetical protein